MWKGIWKLRLPNAVKNFLWCLVKGILPVRTNLIKKGMSIDPCCPLGFSTCESENRLFLNCNIVKLVWFAPSLGFCIPNNTGVREWLLNWFRCSDDRGLVLACATVWKIWQARNSLLFQHKPFTPLEVAKNALAMAAEVLDISGTHGAGGLELGLSVPLGVDFVVPVDAGCFPDGSMGWGCVVKDSSGAVCFSACKKQHISVLVIVVEAMGVRFVRRAYIAEAHELVGFARTFGNKTWHNLYPSV
ncbi:uncharacterized protein LOC131658272 [Vicia villosa]|uniref:uncharacterized protein LOC131658272 n=1 Tax=Vicia villosa TaxID=3911 RepID=UPI00273C0759|nr:uncharacterized protein LOC131658272 [Vicia villosa]